MTAYEMRISDWSADVCSSDLELVTALIKSLPKELRRNFVPAPDTARAILDDLNPGTGSLLTEMQRELRRRSGVVVPIEAFDLSKIPDQIGRASCRESVCKDE